MKLAGQRFRSKATYQLGRIVKTSQKHIFITFNKGNDDLLKLTFEDFLKYCYMSDEMEEEVKNRMENKSDNVLSIKS